MVRNEVVRNIGLTIPLTVSLESLASLRCLFHFLTLAIKVRESWEVLNVVMSNRDLIIEFIFLFVAAIHGLSLIHGARLLASGAIHEAAEWVLLKFDVAGD